MEAKEMTLWDIMHRCVEGLYRLCKQGWQLLAGMLRLSFRLWWLVGLCVVVGAAAGIYYSRPSNKMYKVNAIATLNGPSFQQVADYYESLNKTFRAFAVVDCRHDGTADYVDYKNSHPREDSVNVCMSDQIALQFITKKKAHITYMEHAIVTRLNNHPQFQQAYELYKAHADRQHRFDIEQVEKLDAMTTAYYATAGQQHAQSNAWDLVMGRQEIILPVEDIEEFLAHKQKRDQRYALCTAPVVLHSHFVPLKKAENGRLRCSVLGLLLGWLAGCLAAAAIERRKTILAWLRQGGAQ